MKKIKTIFYTLIVLNLTVFCFLVFSINNCWQTFDGYLKTLSEKEEAEFIRSSYVSDSYFIKDNRVKIEIFDNSFLDSQNPLFFISYLEEEVLRSNLILDFVDIKQGDEKENKSNNFIFKIRVCGLFSNVSNFIGTLEKSPYVLGIKNLSVYRIDKKSENPKDKCGVLGSGYTRAVFDLEMPIKIYE